MLILLCVIFAISFIISALITLRAATEGEGFIIGFFSAVFFAISLIALLVNCSGLISGRYVDDKIAMYQEENEKIEAQIDTTVKTYMDYESGVFEDVKAESSITLVSLFPELKADTLVASQIETYTENNNKIKELKENKIDLKAKKWWVYFGG